MPESSAPLLLLEPSRTFYARELADLVWEPVPGFPHYQHAAGRYLRLRPGVAEMFPRVSEPWLWQLDGRGPVYMRLSLSVFRPEPLATTLERFLAVVARCTLDRSYRPKLKDLQP